MAVEIMLSRLLFILMRGFCCCSINCYCCSHCVWESYVGALFYSVDPSVGIPCNYLAVEEKLDGLPSFCQCVLLSQLCVTSSRCRWVICNM